MNRNCCENVTYSLNIAQFKSHHRYQEINYIQPQLKFRRLVYSHDNIVQCHHKQASMLEQAYARHKQDRDSKMAVRKSVVSFLFAFWLKIFKCSPCHKTDGNMIYLLHY